MGENREGLERRQQRDMDYCLAKDLPTLVWAANLADLELHTSLARKRDVTRPTMMVFDLDPGAPADIIQCCQVGLWLRDLLGKMKLRAFPKTSGSKGLQVYVPLNTPVTFEQTKELSHARWPNISKSEHPDLVISKCPKHCATEKCLSIGARTTNTRRRSTFIRCGPRSSRLFRHR